MSASIWIQLPGIVVRELWLSSQSIVGGNQRPVCLWGGPDYDVRVATKTWQHCRLDRYQWVELMAWQKHIYFWRVIRVDYNITYCSIYLCICFWSVVIKTLCTNALISLLAQVISFSKIGSSKFGYYKTLCIWAIIIYHLQHIELVVVRFALQLVPVNIGIRDFGHQPNWLPGTPFGLGLTVLLSTLDCCPGLHQQSFCILIHPFHLVMLAATARLFFIHYARRVSNTNTCSYESTALTRSDLNADNVPPDQI